MLDKLIAVTKNTKVILWLYTIATALLALLVGYGFIAPDKLPLWLGLVAAVFGMGATSTAGVRLYGQRRDGIL